MKKRRILFAVTISVLSLAISACDILPFTNNNRSQESSQRTRPSRNTTSSNNNHEHRFSEEWSYNTQAHWHDATCGHIAKSDLGSHQFESVVIQEPTCSTMGTRVDMCTICDFQQTVYIEKSDHNWQNYAGTEPTCAEPGFVKRFCVNCGISEEVELPPLGHDFINTNYIAPTCSSYGRATMTCTRCGYTYEEYIPTTDHVWRGNSIYHAPETEGCMGYYTDSCVYCGATKITLRTQEAIVNGNLRDGIYSNYGYTKLASNGSSYEFKFDYPSNAYGRMYQHGFYDNWKNSTYWYYNYHNLNTGVDYGSFNFSVDVNGQQVDMWEAGGIAYYDFFENGKGEYIQEFIDNGYSPVANCLIGDFSLVPGQNVINYTRLNSYNITIDSLVLVIQGTDHVHNVSTYWNFDGDYHWHDCIDINCPTPNVRLDNSGHTYMTQVITEATCHSEGVQRDICTVCGYTRETIIPQSDHEYVNVGSFSRDENTVALEEYGCKFCGQNVLRWSALEYDPNASYSVDTSGGNNIRFQSGMAENINGSPAQGTHIVYNILSPTALNGVGLAFNITQSSGAQIFDITNPSSSSQGYIYDVDGSLIPATKRYGLRVNGVEIELGEDIYGTTSTSSKKWFNWPVTFNLVAGVNTIDIYCLYSAYRARMYEFQITGVPYIEPNHQHTASDVFEWDNNYHYNPCTAGDGARMNEEPHQFGDYVTILEPTCTEYGQMMRTCSVCGYQEYQSISPNGHVWDAGFEDNGATTYTCVVCGATKTITSAMAHNFDESRTWYGVNSENVEYTMRYCADCGKEVQSIPFANGNILSGGYSSGKLTSGTTMSFKFPARSMGLIKIYVSCKMSSGNTNQTYDPSLYSITVNGVNAPILMPKGTYDELGISSSETRYFKWAEIDISNFDLPNGEIEIQFTSNVSSYRMIFDGEMRIEY